MGLFLCILFSIITCWILSSVQDSWNIGWKGIFIVGLICGIIGAYIGYELDLARFDSFNLVSLSFSLVSVYPIAWMWAKMRPGREITNIAMEEE